MLVLFERVLCINIAGIVIPKRNFGAGFHVAGRADNHHVSNEGAMGVAGTAVVGVQCMRPDAPRVMRLLFCSFITWLTVLVMIFDAIGQTGDWTAKDVE